MAVDKRIKVKSKIYLIFAVMFGSLLLAVTILAYTKATLERDSLMISLLTAVLLGVYLVLGSIEIIYNKKFIKYKTLLKTKTLKIGNIKNCYIKTDIKPFKPTVGLYICSVREKEDIIIPVNLFKQSEIEELIDFLNKR